MYIARCKILHLLVKYYMLLTLCSLKNTCSAVSKLHVADTLQDIASALFIMHVAHNLSRSVYAIFQIICVFRFAFFKLHVAHTLQNPEFAVLFIACGLHMTESAFCWFSIACGSHIAESVFIFYGLTLLKPYKLEVFTIFAFLSKIWLLLDILQKCKTQRGCVKIFPNIFMGYEIILSKFHGLRNFFGTLKSYSALVPGIENDRFLSNLLKPRDVY